MTKSMLLVCGATQITHRATSSPAGPTRHPIRRKSHFPNTFFMFVFSAYISWPKVGQNETELWFGQFHQPSDLSLTVRCKNIARRSLVYGSPPQQRSKCFLEMLAPPVQAPKKTICPLHRRCKRQFLRLGNCGTSASVFRFQFKIKIRLSAKKYIAFSYEIKAEFTTSNLRIIST